MIYLDHNASTFLYPEVRETLTSLAAQVLNPSSIHSYGREAKKLIEDARKNLATIVGIKSHNFKDYQITFTSSGTEANNLIISNYANDGDEIFISAVEHSSIMEHVKYRHNISILKVDKNGILDLEDLRGKLEASKAKRKLVSVIMAHNETGIVQPIQKIALIAHEFGALMHSDIVQAIGKIEVSIPDLAIDFATISGHKFGSPVGAGALVAKATHVLAPLIVGGGQERGLRSGTENVISIACMGLAASLVQRDYEKNTAHMLRLSQKLEKTLQEQFPNIEIVGDTQERLPNTTLLINPGKKGDMQVIAFDLKDIAISSGSACSSGKVSSSLSLKAMGYSNEDASSAIRISTSKDVSEEDIDKFIQAFVDINGNR